MAQETVYIDHLNNKFSTKEDMCEFWNINLGTYLNRIKRGWTMAEALSTPIHSVRDHLGNEYKTFSSMCQHYNKSSQVVQQRIERGWPLCQALTVPLVRKHGVYNTCKDHLGNEYSSITEMCEKYGISCSTYRARLKRGMTLRDALTIPVQTERKSG